jgi:hypothetical protein
LGKSLPLFYFSGKNGKANDIKSGTVGLFVPAFFDEKSKKSFTSIPFAVFCFH